MLTIYCSGTPYEVRNETSQIPYLSRYLTTYIDWLSAWPSREAEYRGEYSFLRELIPEVHETAMAPGQRNDEPVRAEDKGEMAQVLPGDGRLVYLPGQI
jgi:hypothetical protein